MNNAFTAALNAAAHQSLDFLLTEAQKASPDVCVGRRVEIARHVEAFFTTYTRSDLALEASFAISFDDDGDVSYRLTRHHPARGELTNRLAVSIHESRQVHEDAMRALVVYVGCC